MKLIWLDDERNPKEGLEYSIIEIARTVEEAIDIFLDLNDGKEPICISFDHDLGTEKTGYDLAKWLVEHKITGFFHLHTMNPVGRENIRQLLNHYGWTQTLLLYKGQK